MLTAVTPRNTNVYRQGYRRRHAFGESGRRGRGKQTFHVS